MVGDRNPPSIAEPNTRHRNSAHGSCQDSLGLRLTSSPKLPNGQVVRPYLVPGEAASLWAYPRTTVHEVNPPLAAISPCENRKIHLRHRRPVRASRPGPTSGYPECA